MRRIGIDGAVTPGGSTAAMVDGIGWGFFFIWIGVCFLADLGWGAFLLGTGLLLFAGQAARQRHALTIDRFALLLGGCLAVAGVARLLNLHWDWAAMPGWIGPVFFIALGTAILVTAWRRGHRS